MSSRKGLPVALKIAKRRQVLSSKFMWKCNSPVGIVSYCLKPNKNILLVSSAHNEPDAYKEAQKTTVFIEFYKSRRCG